MTTHTFGATPETIDRRAALIDLAIILLFVGLLAIGLALAVS